MKAREFSVVSPVFRGWGESPRPYGRGGLIVSNLSGSFLRFREGGLILKEPAGAPSGSVVNDQGDIVAYINMGEQSHLVFPGGGVPGCRRRDGSVWIELPYKGANDAVAILGDEGEITHIVNGYIGLTLRAYEARRAIPALPLTIYSLKSGKVEPVGKPRKCYNGLVVHQGELIAAVSHENSLVGMSLDGSSDRVITELNIPDGIATDGQFIYVAMPYDGRVVTIDPISGAEEFAVKSPNGEATIAPAVGTYRGKKALYCVLTQLNARDSGRDFFDAEWRLGVYTL